jgi:hypothetical protein
MMLVPNVPVSSEVVLEARGGVAAHGGDQQVCAVSGLGFQIKVVKKHWMMGIRCWSVKKSV